MPRLSDTVITEQGVVRGPSQVLDFEGVWSGSFKEALGRAPKKFVHHFKHLCVLDPGVPATVLSNFIASFIEA